MSHRRPLAMAFALMLAGLAGCSGETAPPLATITLDPSRVAVAGVAMHRMEARRSSA